MDYDDDNVRQHPFQFWVIINHVFAAHGHLTEMFDARAMMVSLALH